jgi:hypothetical protein
MLKKLYIFIGVVFSIGLLIFFNRHSLNKSLETFLVKSRLSKEITAVAKPDRIEYLINTFFERDINVSDETLRIFARELNLIPSSIHEKLKNDANLKIHITDDLSFNGRENNRASGSYIDSIKTIKILPYVEYGVLYHEIGHCLDYTYGKPINLAHSDEFISISREEKFKLFPGSGGQDLYCSSSMKEFFAQCYRFYVEKPSMLEEKAPRTYKYFDDMFNE